MLLTKLLPRIWQLCIGLFFCVYWLPSRRTAFCAKVGLHSKFAIPCFKAVEYGRLLPQAIKIEGKETVLSPAIVANSE